MQCVWDATGPVECQTCATSEGAARGRMEGRAEAGRETVGDARERPVGSSADRAPVGAWQSAPPIGTRPRRAQAWITIRYRMVAAR